MILVIDLCYEENSLSYEEFVRPIVEILSQEEHCKVKHFTKVTKTDRDTASHIVLCGTALMDHTTLENRDKFSWLIEVTKPTLGICAGAQTIAAVCGGDAPRQKRLGMTHISVVKSDPLFAKQKQFEAYELHTFGIDCPTDFRVLAKSKECTHVIKHKKKPLYAMLFHPEVRNAEMLLAFAKL